MDRAAARDRETQMSTHETGLWVCPCCGKRNTRATNAEPDVHVGPTTGDLTICSGCLTVLIFGDHANMRRATPEELHEHRGIIDPALRALRAALARSKASK
jgi:hypothetical protein